MLSAVSEKLINSLALAGLGVTAGLPVAEKVISANTIEPKYYYEHEWIFGLTGVEIAWTIAALVAATKLIDWGVKVHQWWTKRKNPD